MDKEYKTVHANIWAPHESIFKSSRGDKAEVHTVKCCNSENCQLFARGECSFLASFSWHACPYGNYRKEIGPTRRHSKYSQWLNERKELYKNVGHLKSHSDILSFVGDYVFLPYAHMDMIDIGWVQRSVGFLGKGCAFLKKELFNEETISKLINHCPEALFGGQIESYQKESVPKFVKHLQEQCPELYEKVAYLPRVRSIMDSYSYIKRKAILQTLTPNVGKFTDIHKGEWIWDGLYLTSQNSKASFMLVEKFEEIRVKPRENAVVEITDNGQVNSNTIFKS